MSNQTVEFCTQEDLPELFARFADWYRHNPRMQECDYFDWQFKHAPKRLSDSEYDFLILREGGSIKGCLGFTGFDFEFDGRTATGGWTHNWYAQDQRDGGLALLLRFMELADSRFIVRFNDNTARVFSLLKVPMIAAIPRWWAALDAAACLDAFKFTEDDYSVILRSAGRIRSLSGVKSTQAVTRFDPLEDFPLAHFGQNIGHAKRTGRYLNWRYFDAPKHKYQALKAADQFAVFRIEPVMDADVSVVRILEWTFDADRTPDALASIIGVAAAERPILIDFQCTCEKIGRLLEQFGFVPQDATLKPMPDLFRPTNYSGGNALAIDLPPHRTERHVDFANWYVTAGDSDLDRVKL